MLRILFLLIYSFPFIVWAADEPTIWYEKALSSSYIKLRSPDGDRQQLSIEDPFFRRYSQAFADRYGMPQEWVVAGLEGAEAIAFRVSDHLPSFCKGNEDGDIDQIECVQPLQCELDLYLEKDTPITRNNPGTVSRFNFFAAAPLAVLPLSRGAWTNSSIVSRNTLPEFGCLDDLLH